MDSTETQEQNNQEEESKVAKHKQKHDIVIQFVSFLMELRALLPDNASVDEVIRLCYKPKRALSIKAEHFTEDEMVPDFSLDEIIKLRSRAHAIHDKIKEFDKDQPASVYQRLLVSSRKYFIKDDIESLKKLIQVYVENN